MSKASQAELAKEAAQAPTLKDIGIRDQSLKLESYVLQIFQNERIFIGDVLLKLHKFERYCAAIRKISSSIPKMFILFNQYTNIIFYKLIVIIHFGAPHKYAKNQKERKIKQKTKKY